LRGLFAVVWFVHPSFEYGSQKAAILGRTCWT